MGHSPQLFERSLAQVRRLSAAHRVCLILRHSERYPILKEEDIYVAELTPEGIRQAEDFGRELKKICTPGRLLSSPVKRCLDTASAVARGAGWPQPVLTDLRISHPFIQPVWNALPLYWQTDPLPQQVCEVLNLALDGEDRPGVLDIFATHDTIVAVLAAYFTDKRFSYPTYWPDYLEGVLIWREQGRVFVQWREEITIFRLAPSPCPAPILAS